MPSMIADAASSASTSPHRRATPTTRSPRYSGPPWRTSVARRRGRHPRPGVGPPAESESLSPHASAELTNIRHDTASRCRHELAGTPGRPERTARRDHQEKELSWHSRQDLEQGRRRQGQGQGSRRRRHRRRQPQERGQGRSGLGRGQGRHRERQGRRRQGQGQADRQLSRARQHRGGHRHRRCPPRRIRR